MEQNLKIEYVNIGTIKPYKRNVKLHPKEQIEEIKQSIEQFGFNDPIGIWKDEIVEGHGRYLAAKELGIGIVPIVRLDGLTDTQRRAYALIHNKLTMNSNFDFAALDLELSDISDIDMTDFGFIEATSLDERALSELFADAGTKEKKPKKIQCPHCGEWFEV